MRYLFDIGHPAEFHFFKNVMGKLREKNHEVMITARDKDINLCLLKNAGFQYASTGRNLPSKIGKAFSLIRNDVSILKVVRKFKPDLIVNFFSPFAAQAGWLCKKPVIGFHDTEIASVSLKLAQPFTDAIVVPECYTRCLPERKTIKFQGYFELCHLHPNYFLPDSSIRHSLKLNPGEKFVLFRFVSHHAIHDTGLKKMSLKMKMAAVQEFSKIARVFISSEEKLPGDLEKYQIKIKPEKIHDVLFYASLCFGESATMSAESAVLGTPAVFLDDKGRGYTRDLEKKYGLVLNFSLSPEDQEQAIEKGMGILKEKDDQKWQRQRKKLLEEHIDVSAFILWLIEQYPESVRIMKENPDSQFKFK